MAMDPLALPFAERFALLIGLLRTVAAPDLIELFDSNLDNDVATTMKCLMDQIFLKKIEVAS